MRATVRILVSDIRYGLFSAVAGRLAIVALVSLFVFFLSYTALLVNVPELRGKLTFGEGILCMFRGMMPYSPASGRPFQFPMAWFAIFLSMLYVMADYPFRDLGGMGSHVIVACGSRWAWWLAKCGWVVACTLVCLAIPIAICAVATLVSGGDWSIAVRPDIAASLRAGDTAAQDGGAAFGEVGADVASQAAVGITPAVAALAVSLVAIAIAQLVVSLLVNPVIGLAVSVSVLLLSAFFRYWWLPGNYLMLARTGTLMRGGFDPAAGIALSALLLIALVVIGGLAFSRMDILGRERDRS